MNYIEFLHNCYVDNIPLFINGEYYNIINIENSLLKNYICFKSDILIDKLITTKIFLKNMDNIHFCNGNIFISIDFFIKNFYDQLLLQNRKMKIEKIKSKI